MNFFSKIYNFLLVISESDVCCSSSGFVPLLIAKLWATGTSSSSTRCSVGLGSGESSTTSGPRRASSRATPLLLQRQCLLFRHLQECLLGLVEDALHCAEYSCCLIINTPSRFRYEAMQLWLQTPAHTVCYPLVAVRMASAAPERGLSVC